MGGLGTTMMTWVNVSSPLWQPTPPTITAVQHSSLAVEVGRGEFPDPQHLAPSAAQPPCIFLVYGWSLQWPSYGHSSVTTEATVSDVFERVHVDSLLRL